MQSMNIFGSQNRKDVTGFSFKRHFYYKIVDILKNTNVIILTGPRKCGKTVALLQLKEKYQNAKYINFKMEETDVKAKQIVNSIKNNKDVIYLIDEITYLKYADRFLEECSCFYDMVENCKTKLIVTGSQSVAIKCWSNRAFSALATYISVDFINYKEWLEFKGLGCSEDSFKQFVLHSKEFTGIKTFTEYLQSCIDETIISNSKSLNVIFNNDCEGLTTDMLISIMYTVLFTLHNHVNVQTYKNRERLEDDIKYFFPDEIIDTKALEKFKNHYNALKSLDYSLFKKAILFLLKTDLITLTYFSEGVSDQKDLLSELTCNFNEFNTITDFFNKVNICIKYPMFYIDVLGELISNVRELHPVICGSIVECYVRGLLNVVSYEYHDANDREIDYIDYKNLLAIEFSISNKKVKNTNFDIFSNDYTKTLLTKNITQNVNNVRKIPYFEYIWELCE